MLLSSRFLGCAEQGDVPRGPCGPGSRQRQGLSLPAAGRWRLFRAAGFGEGSDGSAGAAESGGFCPYASNRRQHLPSVGAGWASSPWPAGSARLRPSRLLLLHPRAASWVASSCSELVVTCGGVLGGEGAATPTLPSQRGPPGSRGLPEAHRPKRAGGVPGDVGEPAKSQRERWACGLRLANRAVEGGEAEVFPLGPDTAA